jgi:hypothetical protein
MALSDCPECWETPCVCGHQYQQYSLDRKIELAAAVLGIKKETLLERIGDIIAKKDDTGSNSKA